MARKGSVLFSVRAPIGAVNIANTDYCIGRGLSSVSLHRGDNKYLYYLLRYLKPSIEQKGTGSTFKSITKTTLEDLVVPLPPLDTQRKIVAILDKAEATQRLRAEADALMQQLLQSVFLEMFGDPELNPKNWPIKEFDYFAKIDTEMTNNFEKYADYPHIGIENIQKDTGALIEYKLVREQTLTSGKYIFTKKHIIYSKIRPYLNKVAIPSFDGVCSADAYPLLVNREHTNRYFFAHVLRSKCFLNYILRLSDRTNIPKVNRGQLQSFTCICPPIELQDKFAKIGEEIENLKLSQEMSHKENEVLFSSLMRKAFTGELVA